MHDNTEKEGHGSGVWISLDQALQKSHGNRVINKTWCLCVFRDVRINTFQRSGAAAIVCMIIFLLYVSYVIFTWVMYV